MTTAVMAVTVSLPATAASARTTELAPEQAAPVIAASTAPAALRTHVRAVKTGIYDAGKLVADAERACPTVHVLLEAIERTDLLVMVEVRNATENGRAQTTMMGSRAGTRWLRVTVDAGRQWREQAAFLAHELRHVMEVAAAPDVQDAPGFGRLYERIGRPLGGGHYETDAAVAAEHQALKEAYAPAGRRK